MAGKYDKMSFGKAFAAARKELGKGNTFTWRGKKYTTNYKEESGKSTPAKNKKVDVESVALRGIEKAEGPRPRARPGSVRPKARPDFTVRGAPAPDKIEVTPLDKPKGKNYEKPASSPKVTYEEWKAMSRSERKERGLPVSVTGWMNQGWTKGSKPKSDTAGSSSRRSSRGMAAGGMTMGRYQKTGNKDYKKTGMFYNSKSPNGYK